MDTLMGALIGGIGGYMLSESNKDMKKVADREVWALGGAALGHLLQDQMLRGQKPDPAVETLKTHNQLLAIELQRTKKSYRRSIEQIEQAFDAHEAAAEAPAPAPVRRKRVPTPRVTSMTPAPRARARTQVVGHTEPARRPRLELPDYRSYEFEDELVKADLAELRRR